MKDEKAVAKMREQLARIRATLPQEEPTKQQEVITVSDERELLEKLVKELGSYNSEDMLAGYLDSLGKQFNKDLLELGLRPIELYTPITTSYSALRDEIYVFDAYDGAQLFIIQGEEVPSNTSDLNEDQLTEWVAQEYFDTIRGIMDTKWTE